jgi:hypothetical protein
MKSIKRSIINIQPSMLDVRVFDVQGLATEEAQAA